MYGKDGNQDDLLAIAAQCAGDSEAYCLDISAMVFPAASFSPSEETLSAVSTKLASLICSIDRRLTGIDSTENWPSFMRSSLVRDVELVDFVLARVAEDRLEARIFAEDDVSIGYLPVQLLDHDDPHIVAAARSLLAADSLHRKSNELSYQELPPELLHRLCGEMVTVLRDANDKTALNIDDAAKALLVDYDENGNIRTASAKLVHFLQDEMQATLLNPHQAGQHIFIAAIAVKLGLEHDHVLRLIDMPSAVPLIILLNGCEITGDDAMEIIGHIKGGLTAHDNSFFNRAQNMETAQAQTETLRWAATRAEQLSAEGPS